MSHFSYQDVMISLDSIISQIHDRNMSYEMILGISPGGAVPAVMLRYALDIPLLRFIHWDADNPMVDTKIQHEVAMCQRVLVVDSVLNSGRTMTDVLRIYAAGADSACVLWNPEQPHIPTYFGKQIPKSIDPIWTFFWDFGKSSEIR